MIKTFAPGETALVWKGDRSKRLPLEAQKVGRRKLRMLDNAQDLDDVRTPPRNKLEKLRGDRAGQYSIGINDQRRICFIWKNGDAYEVEINKHYRRG